MPTAFVMVPVPEDLVHEVVQLIYQLNLHGGAGGTIQAWDQASMNQYFLEADEDTRSLLSIVARGSRTGKTVTEHFAADFIQLGMRETYEIVRRIRESLSSARRPQLVVGEVIEEASPSGRIVTKRVLTMRDDYAAMVRSAEHAVQKLEPHPLEPRIG